MEFSTEEAARHLNDRMVARLVEDGLIRTPTVKRAFCDVLRHRFLPGTPLGITYGNQAVPAKRDADGVPIGSTSEPALMAAMFEQLQVDRGARVLEIGTGTGYNAAVLSRLAGADGHVTTVELHAPDAAAAAANLRAAGHAQVEVVTGDGWDGHAPGAPYDAIEVTVGTWELSPHWLDQLRPGGLLAVPIWIGAGLHLSVVLVKEEGRSATSRSAVTCGFMRMLDGPHAPPVGLEPIGGWLVAADDLGSNEREALTQLLDGEPHWRGTSPLPAGWFLRLLRADHRAIQLGAPDQRRYAAGLLLAEEGSLAVIEGNELLVYGSDAAEGPLRAHLASAAPLSTDRLAVLARPPGHHPGTQGAWLLHRPSTTFVLREPAGT